MIDASAVRLALFTDTFTPQVNGVARTLARLTDALRARGAAVAVYTADDPGADPLADGARFASVPFWAYPQLRLAHPLPRTVDDALRRFRPTLVHAATPFGMGLAGRSAALRHGVPFVSSYHTSFAAYAAHYRLGALAAPGWHFLRWFHNSGQRTFCPTQAIVSEVRAHGFERTAIWSRGIDAERFAPGWRDAAWRAALGLAPDDVLVLYVGRLASEKGLAVAIDAARQVSARLPRVRFAFVGDGPYADVVAQQAPAASWRPGPLHGEALSRAFASADLFLFPSTTDTFGNVLLEAAASGVPVVAADAPPTRELFAGSDAAQLVPPTDATAMAEAICRLVVDAPRRRAMGAAARALAATRDWDRVWDTLVADYLAVLGGRTRVAA